MGSREAFYVEPDCCLLCGIPTRIAPDIFTLGVESCFVRRQPVSTLELDRTIDAMMQTEVDCIRYGGHAAAVLRRLGEAEMAHRADDLAAFEFKPLINNIVRFGVDPTSRARSAADWAKRFSAHLHLGGKFKIKASFFHRTVKFSWYGPSFHAVRFRAGGAPDEWIAAAHPNPVRGIRGVTRVLRDWLAAEPDIRSVNWHTADSLAAGEAGMATPY